MHTMYVDNIVAMQFQSWCKYVPHFKTIQLQCSWRIDRFKGFVICNTAQVGNLREFQIPKGLPKWFPERSLSITKYFLSIINQSNSQCLLNLSLQHFLRIPQAFQNHTCTSISNLTLVFFQKYFPSPLCIDFLTTYVQCR